MSKGTWPRQTARLLRPVGLDVRGVDRGPAPPPEWQMYRVPETAGKTIAALRRAAGVRHDALAERLSQRLGLSLLRIYLGWIEAGRAYVSVRLAQALAEELNAAVRTSPLGGLLAQTSELRWWELLALPEGSDPAKIEAAARAAVERRTAYSNAQMRFAEWEGEDRAEQSA